ncbi:hypothetical protein LZZ90_02470 [Flavobacterium sp. SM15]|uniref:hypothetical protein n=1 Tax=Flavobacterium sp. SM15 TaxID=2908005 RepID=UPI001EDBDFD0|nr:hypothetical protein [Flavobacterium sp. SM15]MCG2610370.1 hypothetical protein [Flavobacterium sp. SM15]
MKSKFIVAGLFILSLFSSCKNGENTEAEGKDNVSIVIETVFAKNDYLQIYYLVKGSEWSDANSVSKPIYASNEMQTVDFELPKGIIPENLRIDLGTNPTQNNVTIKNITVKYKSHVVNGDFGNYSKYFAPNIFVTWDPEYVGHKLIKVDNQYDPFIIGNDLLVSKLKKFKS